MLHKKMNHFSSLVGIDLNVFDTRLRRFEQPECTFCHHCPHRCDAETLHLYGCYESVRWDNKYIYCCPMDLVFVAIPQLEEFGVLGSGIIVGPLLMGELADFEETYGLPHMDTARVNHLAEIASILFSGTPPLSNEESTGDFLNALYRELELLPQHESYPIDLEKQLQAAIIHGDKKKAREYLNRLLGEIFFRSNGDFEVIKTRVLELLVLLSRSAIEGGADTAHIFALNNNYIHELDRFGSIEKLSVWLSGIINRFVSYAFEFGGIKHSVTLHKIISYIRANYMKKITLDEIARHVTMSKSHVSKIFNEEMGMSISAYVNKIRIERSRHLLGDESLTIADVANLTGFEDQSYFTKQFKAATGLSPKKFRETAGTAKVK